MARLGFDERWMGLIMRCIMSVSYLVLYKGEELGPIVSSRGLWQGVLLLTYLFILCTKGLSPSIKRAKVWIARNWFCYLSFIVYE